MWSTRFLKFWREIQKILGGRIKYFIIIMRKIRIIWYINLNSSRINVSIFRLQIKLFEGNWKLYLVLLVICDNIWSKFYFFLLSISSYATNEHSSSTPSSQRSNRRHTTIVFQHYLTILSCKFHIANGSLFASIGTIMRIACHCLRIFRRSTIDNDSMFD